MADPRAKPRRRYTKHLGDVINPEALTVIRERSGFSKMALAKTVGMSVGTLANLEYGRRNASPRMIARLAEALAVPVPALLRRVVAEPDHQDGGTPSEVQQHSNTEPVVEAVGGPGEETL